jgi:hypothetical protein
MLTWHSTKDLQYSTYGRYARKIPFCMILPVRSTKRAAEGKRGMRLMARRTARLDALLKPLELPKLISDLLGY